MSQGNSFRKIFIDSRWRSSGQHNDFSIELPIGVDTTRTSSVYLASCSFSNTFETVLNGVNNTLYAILQDSGDHAPAAYAANLFLYMLFKKDRLVPSIVSSNQSLYVMLQSTAGVGNPYILYEVPVAVGTYSVETLAPALQAALDTAAPSATVAWQESSKSYTFNYSAAGGTATWWIPNAADLDAGVARFNPALYTGTTITPGDHSNTVNAILNMPRLTTASPFGYVGQSLAISYTQPTQALITRLDGWGSITFEAAAAFLQSVLVNVFAAGATVAVTNSRGFTFDTGSDLWSLQIPSDAELRSASWYRANWPAGSTTYDPTAPNSYNASLRIATPSVEGRTVVVPALPPTVYARAIQLAQAQYNTGADLATALQAVLVGATAAGATVSFDPGLGTLTFTMPSMWMLQLPTERELRDPAWRTANWDSVIAADSYSLSDPQSLNGQLYPPSPSALQSVTLTGNIDMIAYREIYVSSSLTNYRTLQSGPGAAQDILARVPIDVDYGQIVSFRSYTHDSISSSDQHFKDLSFRFTDWAGRLVPIDQPVVLELVFLDADPYAM